MDHTPVASACEMFPPARLDMPMCVTWPMELAAECSGLVAVRGSAAHPVPCRYTHVPRGQVKPVAMQNPESLKSHFRVPEFRSPSAY